jgi:hypothetical protein
VKRLHAVAEFINSEPQINLDWRKEFQRFYRGYVKRFKK